MATDTYLDNRNSHLILNGFEPNRVQGNRNSMLHLLRVTTGLIKLNTNSSIKLQDVKETLVESNSNTSISETKSQSVQACGNSNTSIRGQGNISTKYVGNTNCSFRINNDNGSHFTGNRNMAVGGDGGRVLAENNSNMKIWGTGNLIEAKGVSNLSIGKGVHGLTKFQIDVRPKMGWFNSMMGNWSRFLPVQQVINPRPIYLVEYMNTAKLNGGVYDLDNFKFQVEKSETEVILNLKFDDSLRTFEIKEVTMDTIVIRRGSEHMEIKGPALSHSENHEGIQVRANLC